MINKASGAFVALGLIWGSNFIFMKWASETIMAGQITLLRVLFGFLPVLVYATIRRALDRRHVRHLHHFVVMSFLATSVYYYAFAAGTALLPSGIAGARSGAIPLFSFLSAAILLRSEQITLVRLLGILIGFSGVLLIARPWGDDKRHRHDWRSLHAARFSQRRPVVRVRQEVPHRPGHPGTQHQDVLIVATEYAKELAASEMAEVVCHGDPHAGNVLRRGEGWALIDPDGFVGERAYDLGVVMRDACREIADAEVFQPGSARPMLREECRRLAEPANVDPERVWRWGFVERVTTGLYLRWHGHDRESATFMDTATLLAN